MSSFSGVNNCFIYLYITPEHNFDKHNLVHTHTSTCPINLQNLFEIIQSGVDVNALDEETGDAPIHSIVKKKRKDRVELLMALLVNSTVDVNLLNSRGNSALHLAVEVQIYAMLLYLLLNLF